MEGKGRPEPGDGIRGSRSTAAFRALNFELYMKPVGTETTPPSRPLRGHWQLLLSVPYCIVLYCIGEHYQTFSVSCIYTFSSCLALPLRENQLC